jgi:hypothetical protein
MSGYNLQITTKDDLLAVAKLIFDSGLCPDCKNVDQVAYKVMFGGELGVPPIASAQGVFIQWNNKKVYDHKTKQESWVEVPKASMTSALMACLIKKSGRYNFIVKETTDTKSEIEVFEHNNSLGVRTFTIEDAKKAELTTGQNAHNYKKYPRNMLHARNISNIAKMDCTDVFGGQPVYTPEELNMVVDGETGEPILEQGEQPAEGKQKGAATSTAAQTAGKSEETGKANASNAQNSSEKSSTSQSGTTTGKQADPKPAKSAENTKDSAVSTANAPSASGAQPVNDLEFASLKQGIWKAFNASCFAILGEENKQKNVAEFKSMLLKKFEVNSDDAAQMRVSLTPETATKICEFFGANPAQ